MKKRFLWEILDDVAQGKDLVSIFTARNRSPARVWEALGILASMGDSALFRKVASKYRVDSSYLLHRVQGLIRQLEELREEDPYSLLGVGYTASPAEIHQSWKELMQEWHPDRRGGDPRAQEMCRRINEAYELLKDRDKRREYDRRFVPLLSILREMDRAPEVPIRVSHVRKGLVQGIVGVFLALLVIFFLSSRRSPEEVVHKTHGRVALVSSLEKEGGEAGGKPSPTGREPRSRPVEKKVYPSNSSDTSFSLPAEKRGASVPESGGPGGEVDSDERGSSVHIVEKQVVRVEERPDIGTLRVAEDTIPRVEPVGKRLVLPRPVSRVKGKSKKLSRKKTSRAPVKRRPSKGLQSGVQTRVRSVVSAVSKKADASSPAPLIPKKPKTEAMPPPITVVKSFIEAYREENLARLLSLFSRNALENGQPVTRYVARYRQFFRAFKILDYRLMEERVVPSGDGVKVQGLYLVSMVPRSGGNLHWVKGSVAWTLVKDQGKWLISSLDYTME